MVVDLGASKEDIDVGVLDQIEQVKGRRRVFGNPEGIEDARRVAETVQPVDAIESARALGQEVAVDLEIVPRSGAHGLGERWGRRREKDQA